jgi:adenine-specific DNA-methyltransferase
MTTPLKLWSDEECSNQDEILTISDTYTQDSQVVLHLGDTYQFLRTLPDGCAQLIITSPPYNIGKEYEIRAKIQDYLKTQHLIIEELIRLLDDAGSICWQVGNYVEDGEVFPLDILYYDIFKAYGLQLRNRIIWRYNHGLHTSKRFSGRYETILWFTKSENYTFNLDPVRVPSKYPGKRHYKGPNKGMPSGNPLGKNPSDLWEFVAPQWEEEIWEIPQVKAAHPEKTTHPAQYPIELVERCVLALTCTGDRVLDPYCGVGSSLIAALKHKRKTVGCDKESSYIDIARDRLKAFSQGTLPIRPMGKELYKPQGKVSRLPDEWKNANIAHIYSPDSEETEKSQECLIEEKR